jgi:sigma-B regulation protein RsbU (phosphoserine phosphatase)
MAVKILSVDDELPLETLMKQYFRRKIRSGEYEFLFAHNGKEALERLDQHPDIEVILSDINMPEMDGLTLLARIHAMKNPARRVIMVSAYGDMRNIRQAMNNGAFDFATKPIDMEDLSLTIEKAIAEIEYVHKSQQEHDQLESLKSDLAVARDLQQYILPQTFPPFPEACDKIDVAASMNAAKNIGGDFYDFFRLDKDRIALVIADVCGKGIPAALFMAVSRTIIRSKGTVDASAAESLQESNSLLCAYSVDAMFVTVFYAIYNLSTGILSYSNAGHTYPHLVRSDGSTEQVPPTKCPPLGLFANARYKEDSIQLDHGDTLFMYTDGVNEAKNPDREEFGVERLNDILSGCKDRSCQEVIKVVNRGITDFVRGAEQSDDITMLVVKRV